VTTRRSIHLLCLGALAALLLASCWQATTAAAESGKRAVRFDGREVSVPRSWPVLRLARHPGMCVRLDRRTVYLGTPAANQRCPAGAIGRRRAILVEPGGGTARRSALPTPPRRIASASAAIFTGLGFDACTAPSSRSMTAWSASPYRAIGVYIGGVNRGCTQPNLTSSWVGAQTEAGWHLIPTYVGLQAPTSSCSECAKLTTSQATAQGTAAAVDAVAQATEVAMGPGSPIYFDMESYSPTTSATSATLAFLEAWTAKLHALGYVSGVYSSSGSGIADLADQVGTGYLLPDDLWIANWNGLQSTSDPVVPPGAWANHERIHQYRGGHNETYGGVTINIDNNSVDGATVGQASPEETGPIGGLDLSGSPAPGHLRVRGWAFDPGSPTQTLAIRVYAGGRAGSASAASYELGPVANLSRPDVGRRYRQAGANHGFDVTIPTLKSGPQPVCAYAVGIAGDEKLLGCKATKIAVAVTFSHIKATRSGVYVRISCAWPTGTECPGQLALRTRFRVATPRRGGPPRIRVVTRSLGRRPFQLTGDRSHAFLIPFTAGGRLLLRERGMLRAQLIAAIPGGRRVQAMSLRRR
jgi:hypothetical protein